MYLQYRSIQRQLQANQSFRPPYCPRKTCKFHFGGEVPYIKHGLKKILRFPYKTQRFKCKHCEKTFTDSFFRLDYRQKIWGFNEEIFSLNLLGASKRQIGREIEKGEHLVRIRLIKMARWALLMHAKLSGQIRIEEAIVYDGLENFSFSQYDPNNLNHAVGKRSLFTYDYNLCPINRKGRMSPRQQKRKLDLEKEHGVYPRNAIRTSTATIFKRLHLRSKAPFTLFSDRHYQYRRAIELDLPELKFQHIMVSSKVTRNFQNPLFAVNNIDLQARQNLATFKRETISFAKTTIAMLESFTLYMAHRNYMRPKFWGTHRSDPLCSKRSPAMEIGVCDRILKFKEFFGQRLCRSQVVLNRDWQNLYDRVDYLSRRTIAQMNTI